MQDIPEKIQDSSQPVKGKKFRKICAAIIRWLFILLFAVILFGGLYFKAPWKILALDAVLLALLTVVPRPLRKYGWLTLAAAGLAVTVWIFLPEKDASNWKPYSFDNEIQTYNARYAVPNEDNAAVILEDISLKYEDTFYRWPDLSDIEKPTDPNIVMEIIMQQIQARCADFYPDFWTDEFDELTLDKPWKSNHYPQLNEWLHQKDNDLSSLIEASKKQKCQFKYTFDPFPFSGFNSDPSYAMDEWLKLLRRAANNDWGNGQIDEAIQKYNALFRLSSLLSKQPLWSLSMLGMRQYRDAYNSVSHFIIDSELSDKQLNSLEETLVSIEEPDFKSLFKQWLEYQKLSTKQLWAGIYEVNEHGGFRYAHSVPERFFKHTFKNETSKSQFEEQKQKLCEFFSWFFIPTTPQEMSVQIDEAFERVSNLSPKEMEKERKNYRSQLNFRFFTVEFSLHTQLKLCLAVYERKKISKLYQNVYKVYIALYRYKDKYHSWPETVDQIVEFSTKDILIDPMNEGAFVYQKKGNEFVLYSKGKNGVDNKGVFERPNYDPNTMTKDEYYKLEPELDDIRLWPEKLEGEN